MSSERPLDRQFVLEAVAGVADRAVLVGGQAVAWWAEHYMGLGRLAELTMPGGMYVSKDVDFATPLLARDALDPLVRDVASRLHGRMERSFPFTSLVVASVRFRDDEDHERTVEFLRDVHGVTKRERIFDEAVAFEAEGLPTCHLMHPVMLLESRVANLADLEKYQNDRGIQQAVLARAIAREWLRDQLDQGWAAARRYIERVLRLAEHRRGRAVASRYGIDLTAAIPTEHPALPAPFLGGRLQRCAEKVAHAIAEGRAS